ncbi:MAG: O-methyltransferase [Lachnospiraceae bacterium]|nr:O-methyltransferase [Lachnospiraceae bacterium]
MTETFDPDRLRAFIASLEPPKDAFLEELRAYAEENDVPIVRPETEALLTFLTDLLRPARILEVGCAIGYSAIAMGRHLPEGASIDTIENYAPRIPLAKENFEKARLSERITLYEGDASDILPTLPGPYDLIFMDAAKAQYIHWLPEVLRLLSDRGLLVSDNVLQDGDVLQSRYAVTRRDRTIHKRMREYLYTLKHDEHLSSAVLSIGDGVALTVKK